MDFQIIPSELKEFFGIKTFKKGEDYFKRDLGVIHYINGGIIFGEVIGTQKYEVDIDIDTFDNICTCPVERDCKHVVCLLLTFSHHQNVPDYVKTMEIIEDSNKEEFVDILFELTTSQPGIVAVLEKLIR